MQVSEKQFEALKKAGEWLEDYLSPEHGALTVKENSIAGKVLHDYKQTIAELSMQNRPMYCKNCGHQRPVHDKEGHCAKGSTFFELKV